MLQATYKVESFAAGVSKGCLYAGQNTLQPGSVTLLQQPGDEEGVAAVHQQ